MECSGMSDLIFFVILIMLCIAEGFQVTDLPSQPTKLLKTKNVDLTLRCLLTDQHEQFNRHSSVSWWLKKIYKGPCWNQPDDEWLEIPCDGPCKLSLDLNDDSASNGFYLCRIKPYRVDNFTQLDIEVTKTFEVRIIDPQMALPPVLLNDTPEDFSLPPNSQIVLQCKCESSQKPTLKWFRENVADHESYKSFPESSRSIMYMENFYEPMAGSALRTLGDNLYLSKLIVSNITQDSVYVCVAINSFGCFIRKTVISILHEIPEQLVVDYEDDEGSFLEFQEKNCKVVILIPIALLLPISMLLFTIFYLIIHRQILKSNKVPENV